MQTLINKILTWVKTHKLSTFLIVLVIYFLLRSTVNVYTPKMLTGRSENSNYGAKMNEISSMSLPSSGGADYSMSVDSYRPQVPPAPDVKNRMVISDSYMSLLVKSVVEAQKQIIAKAEDLGGYMVNSYLSNPKDVASATVTIRVPAAELNRTLGFFRQMSVKVVSENLQGQDVTDQYVDNEARLAVLMQTKKKFEEIMDKAIKVQDILEVQREIINIQSQIDVIKGQQQYLEKNAEMAKMTVYLSTDEYELPYAPTESWRPEVIFKQAVRSLVGTLRQIGTVMIWIGVYLALIIPIAVIVFFLYGRARK